MPRLERVDVSWDDSQVWVRYQLTKPLPEHSGSAALAVTGTGEFGEILLGARFENGEKTDLYYATPARVRRRALDTTGFVVTDGLVVTPYPKELVSSLGPAPELTAQLVLNGMVVQDHFPVSVLTQSTP